MSEIYIDPFYGSDITGNGSLLKPYKTLQKIISPTNPIMQPTDVVYYERTAIGKPNYVYNLFDDEFWEDSETSRIVKLIRTLQYAVYAQLGSDIAEVQLNWLSRLALSLKRFTSIFNLIGHNNLIFETFKRRVNDVWLAFVNPTTKEALNRIVGAYTYLPTFVERLPDYPKNFILGVSYLDQNPLETYILSQAEYRSGVVSHIFNASNLSSADKEEMLRVMDLNVEAVPFKQLFHSKNQPSGFLTIRYGEDSFDNAVLYNARLSTQRGSYVPEEVGSNVDIRLAPIDILSLGDDDIIIDVEVLDRILHDALSVTVYYRFGTSLLEDDTSWGSFSQLDRAYPQITLESQYVQFRLVVRGLRRTDDYEFYSIILKGNALNVIPESRTVLTGISFSLIVSGGRKPYTYSFTEVNSGGSITNTGYYTAGASAGIDKIKITDSQGNSVISTISVISPTKLTLEIIE